MARRLRARRTQLGPQATVVEARAERLPFAEASFDTVVTTLVLCTVPEVAATLAEIRRVLRPDGRLLVLEHVRSVDPRPRLARWQDRWEHPWRLLGAGCQCNRDIAVRHRSGRVQPGVELYETGAAAGLCSFSGHRDLRGRW